LEASNIHCFIDRQDDAGTPSLPSENSAEPRAHGLGERRIEVAFGPERCAYAAGCEQRLRTHAARCAHILGREAVRALVQARRLGMNLLGAHATRP
jgi:hypothetical protein